SVEDVVKIGDELKVIVTEIDRMGRINLSHRAVLTGEMPAPGGRRGPTNDRRPEGRGPGGRPGPSRPPRDGERRGPGGGPSRGPGARPERGETRPGIRLSPFRDRQRDE